MQDRSLAWGFIYALLCFQFFALADVCVKWLTGAYHFSEIIFFINLVVIISVLSPLFFSQKIGAIKTDNMTAHCIRAFYNFMTLLFTILALKHLTLAAFSAVAFTVPFFVLLLAPFIVNEKIKSYHFGAIFIGFLGTLVISNPTDGEINIGIPFVLLAAFFSAMFIIQTKKMSSSETASAITFWLGVISVLFCIPFLIFNWVTPTWFDLIFLFCAGLCRASANIFLSLSLRHAPASVVSPMDYTTLIWAILFGYLIWGDLPTIELYIGSALIIISGLYLAYRENKEEKRLTNLSES